jgi:predicted lipase
MKQKIRQGTKKAILETLTKDAAQKILEEVPEYRAFFFFNGVGEYSGVYAKSLTVFLNKLKKIDKKSLVFHFKQKDFEKWIRTTLGDRYLANEIAKIKRSVDENELLVQVCQIIEKRLKDLEQLLANEEPYIDHDDDL